MLSQNENGDDWVIDRLTTDHNGDNDAEVERVRRAHPGEAECVMDRRVLGALAPFRCTLIAVLSLMALTDTVGLCYINNYRFRRYSLQATPGLHSTNTIQPLPRVP